MNTTEFTDGLNDLLVEKGHENLKAQGILQRDDRWDLLMEGTSKNAPWDLARALQDGEICRHLASWGQGDLFVLLGHTWSIASRAAFVRGGSLFLISGNPSAPTDRSHGGGRDCAKWFERLIGAPPPIPLDLERLGDDCWGSPEVRGQEILGFPKRMYVAGLTDYTLAAFAGYGSNSYAFYYTRVAADAQMFLRLPWGGFYMDPDEMRPGLIGRLRRYHEQFEEALVEKRPVTLTNDMGDERSSPRIERRVSEEMRRKIERLAVSRLRSMGRGT